MAQLTTQERVTLAEHLETSSTNFLGAIENLSAEQWAFKPDPDTWSIAECSDHVVAVERDLLAAIQRCPEDAVRGAAVQGKERLILKRVPDRSVRVKVPREIRPTGCNASPAELAAHFHTTRAKTLAYVRETQDALHARTFPHFVFQDLDGGQWLLMISLHTGRHTQQIAEVKSHPGFPQ
jgi:hypothetical protein